MSNKKTNRIHLLLEASTLAISFMIGFFLIWFSFDVDQMNFDETFFNKKIYPDFMRSIWVMGINNGILVAVCLRATFQLFLQRISDIGFATQLAVFWFFSCILFFLFSLIASLIFFSEINLFLFWFFPLITVVTLVINIIYLFYSFSSIKAINRLFIWPNWFCSIGLLSLMIEAWYFFLIVLYVPL